MVRWVIDAFVVTFAVLMLTGGTLGDLLGRKAIVLGGVLLFCIRPAMALTSPLTEVLIFGQVITGIGAAGSEPRNVVDDPPHLSRARRGGRGAQGRR